MAFPISAKVNVGRIKSPITLIASLAIAALALVGAAYQMACTFSHVLWLSIALFSSGATISLLVLYGCYRLIVVYRLQIASDPELRAILDKNDVPILENNMKIIEEQITAKMISRVTDVWAKNRDAIAHLENGEGIDTKIIAKNMLDNCKSEFDDLSRVKSIRESLNSATHVSSFNIKPFAKATDIHGHKKCPTWVKVDLSKDDYDFMVNRVSGLIGNWNMLELDEEQPEQ